LLLELLDPLGLPAFDHADAQFLGVYVDERVVLLDPLLHIKAVEEVRLTVRTVARVRVADDMFQIHLLLERVIHLK